MTIDIKKSISLLPVGSSTFEKNASQCLHLALQNPIVIADLINPDKCPLEFLPYLAWAFSVDKWDENWSEAVKRNHIKRSFQIHKQKGTIAAVKRVVEPIGYLVELTEWFNATEPMKNGEFSLQIEVPELGLTKETYNELVRLIDDVRPISRHLKKLLLLISPVGICNVAMAEYSGEIITIEPK
ncbi:Bacteriophage P2-related tail formation protein [Phocoenobacter uteri]|uniref:Bacteriophage P2-related tail formation protein n=1 Tax=Phocoenobacter uteri TaxID=146806 RepID=A0A379CBM5_9PAST|nr:phage tail protein I [Phocoenobacter uteri]MDG6881057.1 phage tail protein [Phocoenobacter uteri]SUB59077.1 Bacteriophage P2-related tail formation protein [Phocoenobacter uteri]